MFDFGLAFIAVEHYGMDGRFIHTQSEPCNQGKRSLVNSAKQLSSYLFLLPNLIGHSILLYPKGLETNLDTAQIVASLDQMGLIFL